MTGISGDNLNFSQEWVSLWFVLNIVQPKMFLLVGLETFLACILGGIVKLSFYKFDSTKPNYL